ncbi:MAG TPA: MBL fold metallo-hydrolase [Tepidisphaeraceae bacterium]|jgi:glyoxylase-like metal-dependent hydrolase (beta-lactamase superfamily II)
MSPPRYQWRLLRPGPILLDGGGMFGLIPRVVWAKLIPPDEQNRIRLAHNCLLLQNENHKIVIEVGSGDKLDPKMKQIFGIEDYYIHNAIEDAGVRCDQIDHVIVSHLHFDHAGGLTRRAGKEGVKLTFPNAKVIVQRREWLDANANRSVMTRTYYRDHLDPIRERLQLVDSSEPFAAGSIVERDQLPSSAIEQRLTSVLPGIDVFLVPGHTWGQQAIKFTDDRGRTVVFTPDVVPTVHHAGAAYNLAYDVEPYMSMVTRHWFLSEAARNDWLLILDHEPGNPSVRVRPDGKGWYTLSPESR